MADFKGNNPLSDFPAWQKLGKEINASTSYTVSATSLPVVVNY